MDVLDVTDVMDVMNVKNEIDVKNVPNEIDVMNGFRAGAWVSLPFSFSLSFSFPSIKRRYLYS